MRIPRKSLERKLFADGYTHVIGVDEVGMGCLAGPVTVCAVMLMPEFHKKYHRNLAGLRDSKLLSTKQRERYSQILKNLRISYSVVSESPRTIDKLNIYQASRRAMRKAINKLKSDYKLSTIDRGQFIVLIDGNKGIPGLDIRQAAFVKGDRRIFAIACASIIAKVHRDALMVRYAKKYPGYGFEVHKGYGTKLHKQRIGELGPSVLHRGSFNLHKS